jgi:hypothetical protein
MWFHSLPRALDDAENRPYKMGRGPKTTGPACGVLIVVLLLAAGGFRVYHARSRLYAVGPGLANAHCLKVLQGESWKVREEKRRADRRAKNPLKPRGLLQPREIDIVSFEPQAGLLDWYRLANLRHRSRGRPVEVDVVASLPDGSQREFVVLFEYTTGDWSVLDP